MGNKLHAHKTRDLSEGLSGVLLSKVLDRAKNRVPLLLQEYHSQEALTLQAPFLNDI